MPGISDVRAGVVGIAKAAQQVAVKSAKNITSRANAVVEKGSAAGAHAAPSRLSALRITAPTDQISRTFTTANDMRAFDVEFARSHFPALQQAEKQGGWIYMDNAGGSHMADTVIARKNAFICNAHFQPFGASTPSQEAGKLFEESHQALARLFNVDSNEIFFGPSTSQNTYVLANAIKSLVQPGDEIILSAQDHEANRGAWERFADEGVIVKQWPVDPDTGSLKLDQLDSMLSDRCKFLAFPHTSNVVGEVNPVREIVDKAHAHGAVVCVDGVAHAGHEFSNIKALGADIYLCSLYKTYGPATGAMVIKRDLQERLANQGHYFNANIPHKKLVPAGPNYENVAAAAGIADYFDSLATHHDVSTRDLQALMRDHEEKLMEPLLGFLRARDDVKIIGPDRVDESRVPTIAFLPLKKPIPDVMHVLNEQKIMASASNFYAVRLLEGMNIPTDPGVVRLSFLHYTTEQEINQLIEALDRALS